VTNASKVHDLNGFVEWVDTHIDGDEKGEAQLYLDRLFQAFGWPGLKEAGASCELRVKNDGGGTSFADLVWKPVVLVEMKKRGADLSKHYRQAFDYWTRLVPNRPRFVILCNFDEFWVYDFETQMDTPVDRVSLKELPDRFGPLAFLFAKPEEPVFGNHQEEVTRRAADKLAECFSSMVARGVSRDLAQRFTLQMLMALFAEDIGLLEKYLVVHLLDECTSPTASYDTLGGLFMAMNTEGGVSGGRYKGVSYFNGGLFAQPARVELTDEEVDLLREAARFNWSKVRPEIFGTLFEHSLDAEQRHASGAHFTSAADIMKIVGPTIVEPWREQIEGAKTLRDLGALLDRIERYRVLDPACGSGNFLYIAYRELKRLEMQIYDRMATEFKSVNPTGRPFGFVQTRNFYGMDINPFAVEIAKVTMMLAHKLAIDELRSTETALPLDNLDKNFIAGDALIDSSGSRSAWPKADVIIGNPPFLGAKLLKPELGVDYVKAIRRVYPEVPGMADFCVYWIRRAHDELPPCTKADPVSGRAGLVGTQNIRNNQSRVGGLDHLVQDGTIVEAVENQPWSGEANVHVSIVNWVKTTDPALLPRSKRLWFAVAPEKGSRRRRGSGSAAKQYDLSFREASSISASLSDEIDVSGASVLECNVTPQRVFQGVTPGHDGFLLDEKERVAFLATDPACAQIVHPYLGGDEILSGDAVPTRFLIDFEQRSVLEARAFSVAFRRIEEFVLPARKSAAEQGKNAEGMMRPHHRQFLERWWQLSWGRADMLKALATLPRYLVCSRVMKRPIFAFLDSTVRPGDALQVFAFADDYSFGVLQSAAHWEWFQQKSSKLKADFRYTPESVFDTFPWPQSPTRGQVDAVAAAGRAIRSVRIEALQTTKGGLRAIYRTLELPGANPLRDAHAALDEAVRVAYGFSKRGDVLADLLALNQQLSGGLALTGHPVGPGVPPTYPHPLRLITTDCLGVKIP